MQNDFDFNEVKKLTALIERLSNSETKKILLECHIATDAVFKALNEAAVDLKNNFIKKALTSLLINKEIEDFLYNIALWNKIPESSRPEPINDVFTDLDKLYHILQTIANTPGYVNLARVFSIIDERVYEHTRRFEFIFYGHPEVLEIFSKVNVRTQETRQQIGEDKIKKIVDAVNDCYNDRELINLLVSCKFLVNPDSNLLTKAKTNETNTELVREIKQHVYKNRLDKNIRGMILASLDNRPLHVESTRVYDTLKEGASTAMSTLINTPLSGFVQAAKATATSILLKPATTLKSGKEALMAAGSTASQIVGVARRAMSASDYKSTTLYVIDKLNAAYKNGDKAEITESLKALGFDERQTTELTSTILKISLQQKTQQVSEEAASPAITPPPMKQ